MNPNLTSTLITNVPNCLSICSCLWLFKCCWDTPKRTIGLYMIMTLGIGDFLFHLLCIGAFWSPLPTVTTVASLLLNIVIRFSIFWASNIAFFLYKMLGIYEARYLKEHFKWSLVVLLLLASGLGVLFWLADTSTMTVVIVTMVIPMLSSSTISLFFYCKSISSLKIRPSLTLASSTKAVRNLFLFSFTQFVTIGPVVAYFLITSFTPQNQYIIFENIVFFCLGLTGFANSLLFYIHKRTSTVSIYVERIFESTASEPSVRNVLIAEYS